MNVEEMKSKFHYMSNKVFQENDIMDEYDELNERVEQAYKDTSEKISLNISNKCWN